MSDAFGCQAAPGVAPRSLGAIAPRSLRRRAAVANDGDHASSMRRAVEPRGLKNAESGRAGGNSLSLRSEPRESPEPKSAMRNAKAGNAAGNSRSFPCQPRGGNERQTRSLETPRWRPNGEQRKVRVVESRNLAAEERAVETATVVGIKRVARCASLAASWKESVTRFGSRTTVSYAARTCGRGRRPRAECTAARACRHERCVRQMAGRSSARRK